MLGVSSATSAVRVREAPASRNGEGGQGPTRGGDLPKALSGCAAAEQGRAHGQQPVDASADHGQAGPTPAASS